MLILSLSWLVFWGLLEVFALTVVKAALITGIIFLLFSLVTEGFPDFKRK